MGRMTASRFVNATALELISKANVTESGQSLRAISLNSSLDKEVDLQRLVVSESLLHFS